MEVVIFIVCYLLVGVATLAFAGRVLKWRPYFESDYVLMVFFWPCPWFVFVLGVLAVLFEYIAHGKEDES